MWTGENELKTTSVDEAFFEIVTIFARLLIYPGTRARVLLHAERKTTGRFCVETLAKLFGTQTCGVPFVVSRQPLIVKYDWKIVAMKLLSLL